MRGAGRRAPHLLGSPLGDGATKRAGEKAGTTRQPRIRHTPPVPPAEQQRKEEGEFFSPEKAITAVLKFKNSVTVCSLIKNIPYGFSSLNKSFMAIQLENLSWLFFHSKKLS